MLLHGSSLGCSLLFSASGDKNCYGAKMAHGIQWVTMIYHGLHIVIVIPHSQRFPWQEVYTLNMFAWISVAQTKKTTKQNAKYVRSKNDKFSACTHTSSINLWVYATAMREHCDSENMAPTAPNCSLPNHRIVHVPKMIDRFFQDVKSMMFAPSFPGFH